MNSKQRTKVILTGLAPALVLAWALLFVSGCVEETKKQTAMETVDGEALQAPSVAVSQDAIVISFKLDPRLTRSIYMGDRWVSPATFTPAIPQSKTCVVEARAYIVDKWRRKTSISPKWISDNPAKVKVEPAEGPQVTITILVEGQSRLTITDGELSKTITIMAEPYRDTLKVTIQQ